MGTRRRLDLCTEREDLERCAASPIKDGTGAGRWVIGVEREEEVRVTMVLRDCKNH